jgi:allantoin racemase
MKLMVINPNTSVSMTNHIRSELMRIKRQDTELTVVCAEKGPVTIESTFDESFTVPETLKMVRQANKELYDAVIINAFSDPGLEAARQISDIFVAGIEETTLHVAAMLGSKFTILTPIKSRITHKYEEVRHYKLEQSLASVRTTAMAVADVDADPASAKARALEVAREAVEKDGAEVIILGCAAMVGYGEEISHELGVTVLDPTATTLKICEGIVDAKLVHSKRAFYATPVVGEYTGMDKP